MNYHCYLAVFHDLAYYLYHNKVEDGLVELTDVRIEIPHNIEYVDVPTKQCDRNYIKEELKWYLSTKPNINSNERIAKTKIWKTVAAEDGSVNSNYGYRILSKENGSQLKNAINALKKNKFSKQSVMYYAFPQIHDYKNDGIHAKSDMICTTHVQCLIRDNRLTYYVYMRSNDAFYGFQNDYSWHRYIHTHMYNKLKKVYPELEYGPIVWHAASFHVYERHFHLLREL